MKNFSLKIVLWIPYVVSLIILSILIAYLSHRFYINLKESLTITSLIILYSEVRVFAENIRKKYWFLTKVVYNE